MKRIKRQIMRGVKPGQDPRKEYEKIVDEKHLAICLSCDKELCSGECERIRRC